MNEVMDTLLFHRSIRKYKERPVEEEILDQIVKAVQAAPNWVNLQHVSVIAIKDKARREKFSELCGRQKHIAQAPAFLVFCADFYRTWIACRQNGQPFEDCKLLRHGYCTVSRLKRYVKKDGQCNIPTYRAVPISDR